MLSIFYQRAMNMGKRSKKKQQQQSGSGRAVLVTFYVARPRRKDGGAASAASSRQIQQHRHHSVHHHYHHHHHLHHHLHGRSSGETRRGSDRRADLLEYSRQLRAASATGRTTTPPHPNPPLPPRRDTKSVSAVRRDDHPAADDDRRLVRQGRLEREPSLQEVRYRCLGYGGDWSWQKVLKLVLPCQRNNGTGHQSSTRSKKRRDSVDNDSKKNSKQAKAWPAAAQLVSKLKANRTNRRRTRSNDDEGLVKKLFSMFRQKPRPGR